VRRKLSKKNILQKERKQKVLKTIARVVCIVVIVSVFVLAFFAWFLHQSEDNHRYFLAGTRIHVVEPNIYDAHYRPGTLVFVKQVPIREVEEGTLISMATSGDYPLTFNNEIFVEFLEEYYGRSLHGIVTENTLARERLPLRAGRYIGVPYMGIPLMGSVLVWIADNVFIYVLISLLLVSAAITVLILLNSKTFYPDTVLENKKK